MVCSRQGHAKWNFVDVLVESYQTYSEKRSNHRYLGQCNGWHTERLNSILVQITCSFALHNDFCLFQRRKNATTMKTSAHVWILLHGGVFDPHGALGLLFFSMFKQMNDERTLKVKISVRRRWSWGSLTPLWIAYEHLSQVQDHIIRTAAGEEKEAAGWRAAENIRGKRIVNELQWS